MKLRWRTGRMFSSNNKIATYLVAILSSIFKGYLSVAFFIMTHQQLEHISIIMDMVAFFFVTVDLYDKSRLTNLTKQITSLSPELNINTRLGKVIQFIFAIAFFIFSMVILNVFVMPHATHADFSDGVTARKLVNTMIPSSIWDWVIATCGIMFGWNYKFTLFYIPKFLALWYLKTAITMFKLFHLEGIMIGIGTVLFVVAKFIMYFAV